MSKVERLADDEMVYSANIPGDEGNHGLAVSFDRTGGYVGISQGKERVLLSPLQVQALLTFVKP